MDMIRGKNIQSLDGKDWKVAGWWPHQWRWQKTACMTGVPDLPVPAVKAEVPGSVQTDLIRAGVISEVDIDKNSFLQEWTEHREWIYEKKFRLKNAFKGKRLILNFLGLDYYGQIILNGKKLAEFEGMFVPVRVDITKEALWGKENLLSVVFYQTPEEYGQFGWTERVKHFKSRFNYIWDWCARVVPTGIWDSVFIKAVDTAHLKEIFLRTGLAGGAKGEMHLSGTIWSSAGMSAGLRVTLDDGNKKIAAKVFPLKISKGNNKFSRGFSAGRIKAWFPNGYGAQKLYNISVELVKGRKALDTVNKKVGFKKIEIAKNENAPAKASPYTLKINGKKVFIQGVNWMVPVPFYGAAHKSLYRSELAQFKTMGCNIIRVWGGAILEKEVFFDLCDEMGLMVLQEFPQSSSGISNLPVGNRTMIDKLVKIAGIYIRRRGWHVSSAVWDCGNELMSRKGKPVDESYPCIRALGNLCRRLDPGKWFLPTSASGPTGYAHENQYGKGIHYEVHGPWMYLGEKTHYNYFNKDDSLARFETGSPGPADLSSLQYITRKEKIWPPRKENPQWVHHGAWWIIPEMMGQMFGKWDEKRNEIEKFVKCGQYLQFESLRYSTESCLRRAFNCSGIMYWAGNEPFLNTANNSIIDAFGHTKMAYSGIQKAFGRFHVSMKYEKLGWAAGETFKGTIFLHCKKALPGNIVVKVFLRDISGKVIAGNMFGTALKRLFSQEIGVFEWKAKNMPRGVFFADIRVERGGKPVCGNVYAFSNNVKNPLNFLRALPQARLSIQRAGSMINVRNTGKYAAVAVRLFNTDHKWALSHLNNYRTIFPGEKALIEFRAFKKNETTRPGIKDRPAPDLRLDAVNAPSTTVKG